MKTKKNSIVLRKPSEIFGATFKDAGITNKTLEFRADVSFLEILKKLKIDLVVSREYENLLIFLSAKENKIIQSFFHLPHPCGLAFNSQNKKLYVASTRNPNQIIEFGVSEKCGDLDNSKFLMPLRSKYFCGSHYFHDIVFMGNELYANSVGRNGIMKIDFTNGAPDKIVWVPKCIECLKAEEKENNHIQLNSIACGKNINECYFSASSDQISELKPGNPEYPVDGKGVIFSGKTGLPIARGLTRPHSARIYKNKILVNNSGQGEFGFIEDGKFVSLLKFSGWTRGLYIKDDTAFVGVSPVLPRFKKYAPGIKKSLKKGSYIYAIDLSENKIIGSVYFPEGDQIFAIEGLKSGVSDGFFYKKIGKHEEEESKVFYKYKF